MRCSLLTASFNCLHTLPDCLRSIDRQRLAQGQEVEHWILDGGSTDGTVECIQAWSTPPHLRRILVSEADQGFYDALNKGLQRATGEILGMLNADDFFHDEEVLARVAQAMGNPAIQGCYGDLFYVQVVHDSDRTGHAVNEAPLHQVTRYWKAGRMPKAGFLNGWMPPHPTLYLRAELYRRLGGFRLDLGTAADYELMLRFLHKERLELQYIPQVQVCMRTGGMSNRSPLARVQANRMDRQAWTVNGLRPRPWTLLGKVIRKIPQYFTKKLR